MEELLKENEYLNSQLNLVLRHLSILKDHDIVLDPALVSLLKEKNVAGAASKPPKEGRLESKEKEKEKEKPRDWVFVVGFFPYFPWSGLILTHWGYCGI